MRKQVETFATAAHIKWSVIWVKPKNGDYTIIRKDFGNDLTEAMRVYHLAKTAGKKNATLRSNNVGFPPPTKLQPHTRRRIVTKEVVVLRKGRRVKKQKKVLESYEVIPMEHYNLKGWWWCAYCREMRRFQRQSGFPMGENHQSFVEAPGYYCPMCGVSHRDFHVRRWNPHAWRQYLSDTQPRTPRRRSTSRRADSNTRSTRT